MDGFRNDHSLNFSGPKVRFSILGDGFALLGGGSILKADVERRGTKESRGSVIVTEFPRNQGVAVTGDYQTRDAYLVYSTFDHRSAFFPGLAFGIHGMQREFSDKDQSIDAGYLHEFAGPTIGRVKAIATPGVSFNSRLMGSVLFPVSNEATGSFTSNDTSTPALWVGGEFRGASQLFDTGYFSCVFTMTLEAHAFWHESLSGVLESSDDNSFGLSGDLQYGVGGTLGLGITF